MFFRIASERQSEQILQYVARQGLDAETPLRTCHPVYPLSQVFPFYILVGLRTTTGTLAMAGDAQRGE